MPPRRVVSQEFEGAQWDIGCPLALPETVRHYLGDVLRLEVGDCVELCDGGGRSAQVRLENLMPGQAQAMIEAVFVAERGESQLDVVLCQSVPKGQRWEWVLEKAAELGVMTIVPVISERTVVKIAAEKWNQKAMRWSRKLEQAARQSQRTIVPDLLLPMSVETALTTLSDAVHWVAHPLHSDDDRGRASKNSQRLGRQAGDEGPPAPARHVLWIGPEGGFSESEVRLLMASGALRMNLGPRILRTETAAVAGLVLLQSQFGDLPRLLDPWPSNTKS